MQHLGQQLIHDLTCKQFGQAASLQEKESKNNFETKSQIDIKETIVEENNRTVDHSKVHQKLLLNLNNQQISDKKPSKLTSDNHTPLSQALGKVFSATNSDSNLKQGERPHDLGRYIGKIAYFATGPVNHKQKYTPKGGHWPIQVLLEICQKLEEGLLWNAELGEGLNSDQQHLTTLKSVTEQVSKTTPTFKIGSSPRNTKEDNHPKQIHVQQPYSEHEHRMKEIITEFEYWAKKNKTAEESDTARYIRYNLEAEEKFIAACKLGEISSLDECLAQTSSERSRKITWPGRRPNRSN